MADSTEDQAWADRIAKFDAWIEERRRDAGSGWANATEEDKLQDIYWESRGVSHGLTVPGAAVLAAIEQNVDVAGLPAVQREMLQDIRASLDAGQFDASPPEKNDRIGTALERMVDAGLFEESLRIAKESTDRPWAELSEDRKVGRLIEMARDSGVWVDWWDDLDGTTPGAHVVETIEREVDYAKLTPWRREGLEKLRGQLDAGELAGENPDASGRSDRAGYALRVAELEARIEDYKHLGDGDPDPGRYRRWGDLSEEAKFDLIKGEIRELLLASETSANAVLFREVNLTGVPRHIGDRVAAPPDEFDHVVANLRQHWHEDGHGDGVETWEDQSALEKIGYLAGYAAKHDVPFWRFVEAAGRTLGLEPGQEFASEELQHLRRQFRWAHGDYVEAGDRTPPLPGPAGQDEATRADLAPRLAELESRIADFQHLGVPDADGTRRPWAGLREDQKLAEVAFEMDELGLASEPGAYTALGRAVDWLRLPEELRREVEAAADGREQRYSVAHRDGTVTEEVRSPSRVIEHLGRQAGRTTDAAEIDERLDEHPLYRAARLGDVERIKTLLSDGWEADSRGARRATALHGAAWAGQTGAARVLLDHGADIEARGWGGRTPLLGAASQGQAATVALLIERGAIVHASDVNGVTALHLAAGGGHVDVAERLIAAGADVDARDQTEARLIGGWTPLHHALAYGHDDLAARLIAAGADRGDEWVGALAGRLFGRFDRGVDGPGPGEMIPWAEAAEGKKLEAIVREASMVEERGGTPVPGAYLLNTIEVIVDYGGLPAAQREWLEDLRTGLDAGVMHPPERPGASDPVAETLATIAGIDHPDGVAAGVKSLPSRAEREAWVDAIMGDNFHRPDDLCRPSRPGPEETPLERVERQIGHIKVIPDPYDFRIEELGPWDTEVSEEWKRLAEADKLSHLISQVDWRDISPEDKRRLLEREVDLARVPAEPPGRGEYQVWHDRGWPQSRIDQMLGGAPPSRFAQDYFHAADVQAGSLEEAVHLTTSTGRALHGDHQPWDGNPGVISYTPKPFVPRDTDAGDVIVDPQGMAHRYDGRGFSEIEVAAKPRLPSPGAIANGAQSGGKRLFARRDS